MEILVWRSEGSVTYYKTYDPTQHIHQDYYSSHGPSVFPSGFQCSLTTRFPHNFICLLCFLLKMSQLPLISEVKVRVTVS